MFLYERQDGFDWRLSAFMFAGLPSWVGLIRELAGIMN